MQILTLLICVIYVYMAIGAVSYGYTEANYFKPTKFSRLSRASGLKYLILLGYWLGQKR